MAVVIIVALLLPKRPFSFVPVPEGQENNDETLLHAPLTPDPGGPAGEGCGHTKSTTWATPSGAGVSPNGLLVPLV